MNIRYPFEREVDGLTWAGAPHLPGLVMHHFDRDVHVFAPRLVAWLYRLLPHHFGLHRGAEYEGQKAPWFLWSICAPSWQVGWMPARRRPEIGLPYLTVWTRWTGDRFWGLPWGSRFLFARAQYVHDERRRAREDGRAAGYDAGYRRGYAAACDAIETRLRAP